MPQPYQPIFTRYFLTRLKGDVEANLHRYENDSVWVHDLATGQAHTVPSRIQLPAGFRLLPQENGNRHDLENTRIVYDAMRGLSRLQAADPRLWAYMCHDTCWDYMRSRWNLSTMKTGADRKDYVLSHYFIKSDQSRALLRNGLARLWWYGYLTYDVDRENPYELTAVLLRHLDIAQQTLERNYGRNPAILHGFLEFILQNTRDLMENGNAGRHKVRKLAAALNLHGGVCVLDNLNKADIKAFLGRVYEGITPADVPEDDNDDGPLGPDDM